MLRRNPISALAISTKFRSRNASPKKSAVVRAARDSVWVDHETKLAGGRTGRSVAGVGALLVQHMGLTIARAAVEHLRGNVPVPQS